MTEPRILTDEVCVSGQVTVDDIARAGSKGIIRLINNRPDHEELGQPTSAELQAAAEAAGVAYVHAPIAGMPGPDTVTAVGLALAQGGPTWMFCRSGMRSTAAWALAVSRSGELEPDTIRDIAARAGYDLSRLPF